MIFDDSSSDEEEEANDGVEMAMAVILNDNFWWPRLRSYYLHPKT
jgi:hypothetical protein